VSIKKVKITTKNTSKRARTIILYTTQSEST